MASAAPCCMAWRRTGGRRRWPPSRRRCSSWAGTCSSSGSRDRSAMSSEGALEARQVWKRFRSDRGRNLLKDSFERAQRRLMGKTEGDWRWVLLDVDVSIGPGEAVGLLGTNGSGKSTLLKVLNGVMQPYAGRVDVQ